MKKIRLLPGLDDADREMIFSGNAQKLLQLAEAK